MADINTHDPRGDGCRNDRTPARPHHLSVADMLRRAAEGGGPPYVAAFTHGAVSVGMYMPYRQDPQKPHGRDELYIVVQGSGTFFDGRERRPFHAGDLLFVPAGTTHRFEDFTNDLTLWVVFYGPETDPVIEGDGT